MASLYKKRGKWHIDYWVDGKRFTKNTGIKAISDNKRTALKVKREIEVLMDSRSVSTNNEPTHSLTLDEAYEICLKNKFHEQLASNSHIEQYKTALKRFKNTVGTNILLKDISRNEISLFITKIKSEVSNATLHTYIRYLKIFFNFMIDEGKLEKNPIVKIIVPKRVKKEIITFTEVQLQSIFNEAKLLDQNLFDIFKMLSLTGLRPMDLVNLCVNDIDLDKKILRVHISKTKKVIFFPIYEQFEAFIKERLFLRIKDQADGKIFPGYHVDLIGDKFKLIKRKLNIPADYSYTLKTFRKTFATRMASAGIPIFDVANLLGHDSVNTTMKYYTEANVNALRKRLDQEIN